MVHFHVITVFPYEPSIVVDRYAMFIPGFNWTSVAEATLDARRARLRTVNGCCGLALGQTVLVVRWFCVRSTQARTCVSVEPIAGGVRVDLGPRGCLGMVRWSR